MNTKQLSLSTLFLISSVAHASNQKIGVLFSSYGDINSPSEAEGYLRAAINDPDVAPIPGFLKGIAAEFAVRFGGEKAANEYRVIGGSHYRQSSREQAALVKTELKKRGLDAEVYTGFVFTFPFIKETMRQIQDDGVTDLIVFNQGAQYSKVTQGINIREVKSYLKLHPEYKVNAKAVRSFSEDPRFRNLLEASIQQGINENFSAVKSENLCLFLPAHGVPTYLPKNGDPAYQQMLNAYQDMKARFPNNLVFTGFQNHSELGSQWTQPDSAAQAEFIAKQSECSNILINGRISFTVDNIETLFDEGVAQRKVIEETRPDAKVAVQRSFDSEQPFAEFMAQVTAEALQNIGDLETIASPL